MVDVPSITAHEPVFPSVEHEESVWVEGELVWEADEQAFVNYDSDDDWVLDEAAHHDSTYEVDGTEYESLEDAVNAALEHHPENLTMDDVDVIPVVSD